MLFTDLLDDKLDLIVLDRRPAEVAEATEEVVDCRPGDE